MLVGDGSWLFVGNGSCLFVGDGSWLFVGSLWHLAPKKIGEDKCLTNKEKNARGLNERAFYYFQCNYRNNSKQPKQFRETL